MARPPRGGCCCDECGVISPHWHARGPNSDRAPWRGRSPPRTAILYNYTPPSCLMEEGRSPPCWAVLYNFTWPSTPHGGIPSGMCAGRAPGPLPSPAQPHDDTIITGVLLPTSHSEGGGGISHVLLPRGAQGRPASSLLGRRLSSRVCLRSSEPKKKLQSGVVELQRQKRRPRRNQNPTWLIRHW